LFYNVEQTVVLVLKYVKRYLYIVSELIKVMKKIFSNVPPVVTLVLKYVFG